MFFPAGKSLEAFEWDYTGSVKRLLAQSLSLYGNKFLEDNTTIQSSQLRAAGIFQMFDEYSF